MTRNELSSLNRGDVIYSASGKPYRVTGHSIGAQVYDGGKLVGYVGDTPRAIVYSLRDGKEYGAGREVSERNATNWRLSR